MVTEMTESVLEELKTLHAQMERTFNVRSVIGEPMVFEDKTVIPIVKTSFGIGGGQGGQWSEGKGGMGFGLGGGVEAVALLIVFKGVAGKEGLQLIELKPRGALGEIAQVIPKVMEAMGGRGARKLTEKQEEEKKKLMEI